ncbi:MAG: hypothetical protein ACUZ8I_07720 [Candidatus Scalindua sp.]
MKTIRITDIQFTDEDRKDKQMRKSIAYLKKVFEEDIPEWIIDGMMKICRNDRHIELLSKKSIF